MVKVEDVCKPFDTVKARWSGDEVQFDWDECYCFPNGIDILEEIALVEDDDGRIIGYFEWTETAWGNNEVGFVKKYTKQILPYTVISADTPLLEAVKLFAKPKPTFYLVIKGAEYIGWLPFSALYSMQFKICLFALLIDLEQWLQLACKAFGENSLERFLKLSKEES
ncbi:MAG: hypothetical protein HXX08_23610 [Chloroflexi bacterium]|uniref:Uncharacterized protein n=1 Tax=Candidatus Chlorohelix allophototropha TaxID=3003348 RepID=A0A8T7M9J7_9CHLR|nr:hypothetical protein [Chloroflexota bacterium]WJW68790.1 hypothetical protein OZ401_004407 [Chloroflexota bacterium L227-S17]